MASDAEIAWLQTPAPADAALGLFSQPVRRWFVKTFSVPTPIQRLAWPAVARGEHVLISGPTGSGKTLAAFMPIVDHLGRLSPGGIRCLYIAPLKALANDVAKALRRCRRGIGECGGGREWRLGRRTGDTSARCRQRQRAVPPDLLLTTPESLAILLSQPAAEEWFAGLRWVVVDEIHALAASKRGADLALSLERLTALAGQSLQRIGLSATCEPPERAARLLAGADRPVALARVTDRSPLELRIEPLPHVSGGGFLPRLLERLVPEVEAHQTTLIFANTRSLAERLTWALRRRLPHLADRLGVHHASVSAERRRRVERRLKRGGLKAVVSSSTLELGIDIGSVDLVVLVHPPGEVVRLVQRVGRSGHGPGRPRRGLILTAWTGELLAAAVTAASGQSQQLEPISPLTAPLDVLCQQLAGMAAQRPWTRADALAVVRRAEPFRTLSDADFDACLDYLSGRGLAGSTASPPRLRWAGDHFQIANRRTARQLRRNLGTILSEEQRLVRLNDGSPLGEVDRDYAERLRPGDHFLLEGRCVRVDRVDATAVEVAEAGTRATAPSWQGSAGPLSLPLARRLYLLRCQAAEALREGPAVLANVLRHEYGLGRAAVADLVRYFQRQELVSEIPDAHTCLVEVVLGDFNVEHYVHTPLNRAGNDALARVAVRRLARELGRSAVSLAADLGFLLTVSGQGELSTGELRQLLRPEGFRAELQAAIDDSALLADRFRAAAYTGLLVWRQPRWRRRDDPEWVVRRIFNRLRATDPDFILLRQARSEVMDAVLDVAAAVQYAEDWPQRQVRRRRLAHPSPFAASWTQLAVTAAESTTTPAEALERLRQLLLTAPG
ncbi:MAG: DEAD/DEAH box helicase [Gemmataceae bacterium]|nr:DEAD/DEAH box helicase [Gemmataceae bacterium]MDW8265068.1 DEAD/DEAH box helicase [Gemmataceae bacterium]